MKKVFFALILGLAGVNSAQGDDGRERYVEECLSVIGRPTVMVTSSYGKLKYNFDKDGAPGNGEKISGIGAADAARPGTGRFD